MNGAKLYKKIAKRETLSQKWNDLSDDERAMFYRLAQGVEAQIKLHNETTKNIAKYLMTYTTIKEQYK